MRGARQGPVGAVDQGFQLVGDQPAVVGGESATEAGIPGRGVLVNAFFAGVVNADDDQRLEEAAGDQLIRGLADPPVFTGLKCGLRVEQVLPVVHVKDGVAAVGVHVVTGGEPNQDISVVGEELGVKPFVPVERGVGRVHLPHDQYMFQGA